MLLRVNDRTEPSCGRKIYFILKTVFIFAESYHCSTRILYLLFYSMNPFDGTRKLCFSPGAALFAMLLMCWIKRGLDTSLSTALGSPCAWRMAVNPQKGVGPNKNMGIIRTS